MSADPNYDAENAKAREAGTYWKLAYGHYTKEGGSQHCGQIVYGKAPLDRFCEKCGKANDHWEMKRQLWSRYVKHVKTGIVVNEPILDIEDL